MVIQEQLRQALENAQSRCFWGYLQAQDGHENGMRARIWGQRWYFNYMLVISISMTNQVKIIDVSSIRVSFRRELGRCLSTL
jgi:hypothetical protein